jgi:hypothetical protein
MGHKASASGFEQLGIRPGLPAALLAGTGEILGGFSLAAGLLTPAVGHRLAHLPCRNERQRLLALAQRGGQIPERLRPLSR